MRPKPDRRKQRASLPDCPCCRWDDAVSVEAGESNADLALLTLRVVLDTAAMTIYRRLAACLANLAVFICLIGVGIAAGGILAATEAIDDRREGRRHHTSRR